MVLQISFEFTLHAAKKCVYLVAVKHEQEVSLKLLICIQIEHTSSQKQVKRKDDTILKLSFKFMERSRLRYRQLTRVKQPISFHNINTEHEVRI